MALTENVYIGDGYATLFPFNFEYIVPEDVKVDIDGEDTTEYTLANLTTVELAAAPPRNAVVRVYRETSTAGLPTTFYSGSTITAKGLNDNFNQTLFVSQEVQRAQAEAISSNDLSVEAITIANEALTESAIAKAGANQAAADAQKAQEDATAAAEDAEEARQDAESAQEAAAEAVELANNATQEIQAATEAAEEATQAANDAVEATAAIEQTALDASADAAQAISTANAVDGKAQTALDTADDALAAANLAVQPGDNVSDLTNDAGYITASDVPNFPDLSSYVEEGDNVSVLTNDAGYITSSALSTYVEDGDNVSVLANDAGYITSADIPSAPDLTPYVEKAGSNMTGDLTLGTDKITLDASDGSASFAGNLEVKANDNEFVKIEPAGVVKLETNNGAMASASALQVKYDGTQNAQIGFDGSASFAGGITAGNTIGAENGNLRAYLSPGNVNIQSTTKDSTAAFTIQGGRGGASQEDVVTMTTAGSATFAGTVSIGGGKTAADGYGTDIQEGQLVLRNDNFSPTSGFRILKGGKDNATNTTAAILNDGSASFAGGNVNVQVYDVSGTDTARIVVKDVAESAGTELYLGRTANDQHITAYTNNVEMFHVDYSGSASFAGEVIAGGLSGSGGVGPNAYVFTGYVDAGQGGALSSSIDRNGSAQFAGNLDVGSNGGSSSGTGLYAQANGQAYLFTASATEALNIYEGTERTVGINSSGSASFAGGITSNVNNNYAFKVNGGGLFGYGSTGCSLYIKTGSTYPIGTWNADGDNKLNLGDGIVSTYNITLDGSNGSATFTGTVSAQGSVLTSDRKFKTNIEPASSQLSDVVQLGNKLSNWNWNESAPVADKDTRFLGLIAQEAEEVCPGIVATMGEGEDSYKAIKSDVLVMKLLGAVAELTARVEDLERELHA